MSLQYLLDGYNIIHKMGNLPDKLEDQRSLLVRYIEHNRPQGSLNNQITVVFDGQAGVSSPGIDSNVKVIFSKGQSADDKIKAIVACSTHSKNIVVVTDDREIQYAVRASGACVCSVEEFLSKRSSVKKPSKHVKNNANVQKNISKNLEDQINQELSNVWLKKNTDEK